MKQKISIALLCIFLFSCLFTSSAFAANKDVVTQISENEKEKIMKIFERDSSTELLLKHVADFEYKQATYYQNESKMLTWFFNGIPYEEKLYEQYEDTWYIKVNANMLDQHIQRALDVKPTHNFKSLPKNVADLSPDVYTTYYSDGFYYLFPDPGDDRYVFINRDVSLKTIEQVSSDVYCCKLHILYRDFWVNVDEDPIEIEKNGYMLLRKNGEDYQILELNENRSEPSTAILATYTSKNAIPSASKVLVNGKTVTLEAYNIEGSNYFKLRDLASILAETNAAFAVEWDSNKNAINLMKGSRYSGQVTAATAKSNQKAVESTNPLYVNGAEVSVAAYNINGSTYFKLRDLGNLTEFAVGFDSTSNTVTIDA